MNNLKFKFEDAVPSQMNEPFATCGTNFWQEMIKNGHYNQEIHFENALTTNK